VACGTCEQHSVRRLPRRMLLDEQLRRPNKDLKRAGHVEDLGAWRGKKYDGSGMVCSGASVIGPLHSSTLMPRGDGSNDKRASFSANPKRYPEKLNVGMPAVSVTEAEAPMQTVRCRCWSARIGGRPARRWSENSGCVRRNRHARASCHRSNRARGNCPVRRP